MRSFLPLLLCGVVLFIPFGCQKKPVKPIDPIDPPKEERVSALRDCQFKQGFNLLGLDSGTDSGIVKVIQYGDTQLKPQWEIAQWWSRNNLKDGKETKTDNSYKLVDPSKSIELARKNGFLSLALDGSREFDTINLFPPAKWPHLLLSQTLDPDIWLKDASKVYASLDFTLDKSENLRGGTQGCQAQFAWFIYVVDKNPQSEGFGNFLWFGLNIYDSTKVYAAGTAMQDSAGGTGGNYIYTLGANEFLTKSVKVGVNQKFEIDILPYISKALDKAQQNGFMRGTSVENCCLTGMNIGWEIFDKFDEKITIFNIGIDRVLK